MPIHVTHINFAKGFRGGERQTLNLMRGLARLGCGQSLVCRPAGELMRRAGEEVDIEVIPSAHPLLGHVSVPRTEIIHVHEARGAYWAWLEYRMRRTPYLITRRVMNKLSSGWLTRRAYADAAMLAGVSTIVASRLSLQTGRKVEVVLDSCAPLEAAPEAAQAIRHQLHGSPIIGHVGVLHNAVKGQSLLIAAFKELVSTWPQARLVLVGDGPDRERLRQLAAGDERIVFAGQQHDVAAWLGAMDVFAFPSRMEALGSSVLDAMMLGVPVVASTAGGLPELTGVQERGLSVAGEEPREWADAIKRILSDKALRERLVDAGRAFASQHDIDAHAKHYLSLYRRLAGLDRT